MVPVVDTAYDHSLTDEEYRISTGLDYLYFEIVEPEVLAYTFKVTDSLVIIHTFITFPSSQLLLHFM